MFVVAPFILGHHHQAGHAVNVPISPIGIRLAAAGVFRQRRVAVNGQHRQRAARIPRGEVPRKTRTRRMAERHHRREVQLRIARYRRKLLHHVVEAFARVLVEPENKLKRRRDENFGDAFLRERFTECRVFQYSHLDHVVLSDNHSADLFAVWRNPEERAALAKRHGPLPLGASGGTNHQS